MTDGALEEVHLREESSALEASFVPGAGMLCRSLRHRGHQLLAQNAGVAAYARQGKTMGIPLLYPWANRLAGFDYSVRGRTVAVPRDPARVRVDPNGLPIHGVVGGLLAWELADGSGGGESAGGESVDGESAGGGSGAAPGGGERSSLSARLSWSEERPELFEVFPFRHDLLYHARLRDGRLEIELTVQACGEDRVPVAFGFHPYLVPSDDDARERWLVELPAMRALALDSQQIPVGAGRELAAERFQLDGRQYDDGFDGVADAARFSVAGGGRRIELTFLRGYPCAQVFAPPAGRYICFEPMTAPTNALCSGDELRLLAPGERFTAGFAIGVGEVG